MVCMPVIAVHLLYLVHLQHTVFCDLPDVLAAISYSHTSTLLIMQYKVS